MFTTQRKYVGAMTDTSSATAAQQNRVREASQLAATAAAAANRVAEPTSLDHTT